MIKLSEEFKSLTSKVYTFGLLAFAAKFLPVTKVSAAGMELEISDRAMLVGLLAILCISITTAALFCLARDIVTTWRAELEENGEARLKFPNALDLPVTPKSLISDSSKHFSLFFALSWIVFAMEGVIALLFGASSLLYVAEMQLIIDKLREKL